MTLASLDSCRLATERLFEHSKTSACPQEPKWPGLVGIETEMFPVTERGGEVVAADHSQVIEAIQSDLDLGDLDVFRDNDVITGFGLSSSDTLTFEPGGQLEYSSKPFGCLSDAIERIELVQARLDAILSDRSIYLVQVGTIPWQTGEELGLQVPKHRYRLMDSYFEKIGPFGRQMMRQTGSLQVCLDFGYSEQQAVLRFLSAQILAPYLSAIFSYSPYIGGAAAPVSGFRNRIWQNMDPGRTGFCHLENVLKSRQISDCIETYLNKTLDSRVIVTESQVEVPEGLTFRSWLATGVDGVFPTLEDFKTHQTLLFPEVRPKGFIEVRSADSQARHWQSVPASVVCGIVYDEQAAEQLLERFQFKDSDLYDRWCRAETGLANPELASEARWVMDLAVEGYFRLPSCFRSSATETALLSFKDRYTAKSLTPGEELKSRVKSAGQNLPSLQNLRSVG